jgi:hypothetical protein
MAKFQVLDAVRLVAGCPDLAIEPGTVGTLVEELGQDRFELEIADETGRTVATFGVQTREIEPLK